MAISFGADEIFEMAEEIERSGEAFYRKAAGLGLPKRAKAKLLELAAMEAEHGRTFAAMRERFAGGKASGALADLDDEAAKYLRAFVERRVFDSKSDPASRLTGAEKLVDILRIAIGLEKDSIVFYIGIKEMVPPELGQAQIEGIIREEMSHVAALSAEMALAGIGRA
jgi:rubrerythrin